MRSFEYMTSITYTGGMEEMGPGRTGMVGKGLTLHYEKNVGKFESRKARSSTYRSFDILKGLASWDVGNVTGSGLRDRDNLRAIGEESGDVTENGELGHDLLELLDH